MTFEEVKEHFGGCYPAARALGYTPWAVYKWERNGVPVGTQYRIQVLTGGVLKASEHQKSRRKKKRR